MQLLSNRLNVAAGSTTDLPPLKSDFRSTPNTGHRRHHVGFVLCVDGSGLARAFFTSQAWVGAAMCSAFRCGSHDRWP